MLKRSDFIQHLSIEMSLSGLLVTHLKKVKLSDDEKLRKIASLLLGAVSFHFVRAFIKAFLDLWIFKMIIRIQPLQYKRI